MAGRSTYSPEDKAAVLAVLAANGGNIKRTARETGIAITTVRNWSRGNTAPPSDELVQAAVDEFVKSAERIREMALVKLEAAVESGEVKARDLITVIGVLDDKITRASGLPTQRTEHQHALPSREELQSVLGAAIGSMIEAAERRDGEIVEDAEYTVVPPRALPPARE
jgi:transposase-like protein